MLLRLSPRARIPQVVIERTGSVNGDVPLSAPDRLQPTRTPMESPAALVPAGLRCAARKARRVQREECIYVSRKLSRLGC